MSTDQSGSDIQGTLEIQAPAQMGSDSIPATPLEIQATAQTAPDPSSDTQATDQTGSENIESQTDSENVEAAPADSEAETTNETFLETTNENYESESQVQQFDTDVASSSSSSMDCKHSQVETLETIINNFPLSEFQRLVHYVLSQV